MPDPAEIQLHYRTCHLCEAMCGLAIAHDGRRVISIRGDEDDPFSRGHICPKATALQDLHEDPDRLRRPVRRTPDGGWEEISWEAALDEAAARLKAIQAAHGNQAVGVYLGNPTVHNLGSILYASQFVRALRTRSRFSATSVDQLPHHFAAYHMLGHQLLLPIPDIDRTDLMVILGANPLASNGSLMTAPDVRRRLRAIQQRGGQVIVIDPRRTETAAMADRHEFIRPGTDVFLLLAMLHVAFAEGLIRPGPAALIRLEQIEQIAALARPFSPEAAADLTGIKASGIRSLTRRLFGVPSAVVYGRMGTSTQPFGAAASWLIQVLNVLSGNFDRPGGMMFPEPAFDVVAITRAAGATGSYGRWRSRVRGLPEFGGELPSAALAEEMLTPGEGQIRALVTIAGNPVLSTPNGRRLESALTGLDFMVAVDIYINETTRFADLILPPTTGLETAHYDLVFHALAVRNTVKWSEPLFPPADGALADWQIFAGLRDRLNGRTDRPPPPRAYRDPFRLPPHRIVDRALRFGAYGSWGRQAGSEAGDGLSLKKLKASPHGIDLGPLRPCLPRRITTPDRLINLAPDVYLPEIERAADMLAEDHRAGAGLQLIGRRDLRSNNSWMHNCGRLVRGKPRCTALMHPDDARRHHLVDGQVVCFQSRTGKISVPVEISGDIMPGVVSIPHGWGHDRPGVALETACARPGASLNDLTDELAVDPLTGNAAFSGVEVWIAAGETD